jgi:hypothetical protein
MEQWTGRRQAVQTISSEGRTKRCAMTAPLSRSRSLPVRSPLITPELRPASAPRAAQLLEEGVVVDLDPLVEDAALIVVAEDVGQLEHDVLPIGWQRPDR